MFDVYKKQVDRSGRPTWLFAFSSCRLQPTVRFARSCKSQAVIVVRRMGLRLAIAQMGGQGKIPNGLPGSVLPWYRARVQARRGWTESNGKPRRGNMKTLAFAMVACLACSVGANGYMAYQNTKSRFLYEIEQKRGKINEDMLNEVLWTRMNGGDQNQIELARMQGYNEGINALVHKVDPQQSQISAIWHAGYNRGLEQSQFIEEMGYEKGFANGVEKGRDEIWKAIDNLLQGKEDIQTAIKEFAKGKMKLNEESKAKPSDPGK